MTLLVGIHSEGGAVIAADRQLTQGMVGTPSSKVRCFNDNTVFAASGPVGLGQQVEYVLFRAHATFEKTDFTDCMIGLQPIIQEKILNPGYAVAKQMGEQIPACACIFASVFKDGPAIAYMDGLGNFTKLNEEHPFICMGSGAMNGVTILSSLWSVFFTDATPSLQDAIFAAYSTVSIAIAIRSPNVGFGEDVCILRHPDKNCSVAKAEQIPAVDLEEHLNYIEWVRNTLLSSRNKLSGKDKSSPDTGQIPSIKG